MSVEPTATPLTGNKGAKAGPSFARMLGVSMSLATLLLIDVWQTVVQVRSPESLYLSVSTPVSTLEISALLNLLVFTGLLFFLTWILIARRERRQRRGLYLPAAVVGGLIFWRFEEFVVRGFAISIVMLDENGYASHFKTGIAVYVALCILTPALIGPAFLYWPRKAWNAVQTAALVLFPFSVLCIGQTCWQAAFPPHITAKEKTSWPAALDGSRKPLVLWLIFDEMDQSAAFRHSLGDFDLPNLSALGATSVQAERACEPARFTARAIPSYTLGRKVASVRWDSADDLLLRFEGSGTFVPWTQQRTLFHDAAGAGRRTAILGYFHPYCRLFGDLTSACEGCPYLVGSELMKWWSLLQSESLPKAVLLQADHALPFPSTVRRFDGERFRIWQQAVLRHVERQHLESVARLRRSLLHILADRSIDFAFVHLPLPHPPALPRVGREDGGGQEPGYASDLRTADLLLGEIRGALVSAGRWDETALVLSSDHTVRWLWTGSLVLSPSLLQAIKTLKERTVPFLVKLPYQTQALRYTEPFNAVVVHGVVRGLLREEFKKPEEVIDYIRRNADGVPCPA